MALTSLRDQLRQIVAPHLGEKDRYRCLLVQSPDVGLLTAAGDCFAELFRDQAVPVVSLAAADLFDEVGAVPCDELTNRVSESCSAAGVVLTGPLNFLDYWSPGVRGGFWTTLAALMRGPGVIVLDAPREELPEAFRVVDRLNGFDVKLLKSRLSLTRGHIV